MKFLKPKFWHQKYSIFSFLLAPLALIIVFITYIKKIFFKAKKFDIPIICVGNIYVGGTGKTPISILLSEELSKLKRKPVIIKKFYKDHQDEHSLIKSRTKALIVKKNRSFAISEAVQSGYNVAILDDGFQDHSIKKDINILCFNKKQLIGNGMVMPSGPLRERLNSIRRAHIIIINGSKDSDFEKKILNISKDIQIYYAKYFPINIEFLRGKNLCAFAGIGNPNNFFDLLIENNLKLKKNIIFPDHYNFSKKEIEKIVSEARKDNLDIVTTEKDYQRIKNFGFEDINFIKIKLEIYEKNKMMKQLLSYL